MPHLDPMQELLTSPKNVRFSQLMSLAETIFGKPRNSGSSHWIFHTGCHAHPLLNIQKEGNKAKEYQVKQFIKILKQCQVPTR